MEFRGLHLLTPARPRVGRRYRGAPRFWTGRLLLPNPGYFKIPVIRPESGPDARVQECLYGHYCPLFLKLDPRVRLPSKLERLKILLVLTSGWRQPVVGPRGCKSAVFDCVLGIRQQGIQRPAVQHAAVDDYCVYLLRV